MENLNKAIKSGFITLSYHKNAPMCDIANVIKSTDKAVQISLEHINKNVWIPKSAFEFNEYFFSIKPWFKRKLSNPENKHVCIALGVLA